MVKTCPLETHPLSKSHGLVCKGKAGCTGGCQTTRAGQAAFAKLTAAKEKAKHARRFLAMGRRPPTAKTNTFPWAPQAKALKPPRGDAQKRVDLAEAFEAAADNTTDRAAHPDRAPAPAPPPQRRPPRRKAPAAKPKARAPERQPRARAPTAKRRAREPTTTLAGRLTAEQQLQEDLRIIDELGR